jgi:Reverse transcriptase (RNA-dependent DNA polymerase)
MKSCTDVFSPLIARLVALSFNDGVFPMRYKTASVTPLLKKKGLDGDNLANCRLISNLHTVSKIVERLFLSRIISHVELAPCFSQLQSAYQRGHSTETALLRLSNDIFTAADNKSRTLLIQLDMSAAFDTIDSRTLITRLERSFGLSGTVLSWIRSYIEGRQQFTRLEKFQSEPVICNYEVPQGLC